MTDSKLLHYSNNKYKFQISNSVYTISENNIETAMYKAILQHFINKDTDDELNNFKEWIANGNPSTIFEKDLYDDVNEIIETIQDGTTYQYYHNLY